MFSYVEDLIFDPFCGSGTTLVAAEATGRSSVGLDLVPEYLTTLAVPRILAARDARDGALTDSQGARWTNLPLDAATSVA